MCSSGNALDRFGDRSHGKTQLTKRGGLSLAWVAESPSFWRTTLDNVSLKPSLCQAKLSLKSLHMETYNMCSMIAQNFSVSGNSFSASVSQSYANY